MKAHKPVQCDECGMWDWQGHSQECPNAPRPTFTVTVKAAHIMSKQGTWADNPRKGEPGQPDKLFMARYEILWRPDDKEYADVREVS